MSWHEFLSHLSVQAATLLTADGGEHLGELYKFLIAELGPESPRESRRKISRRLRAVVMKSWTLVGMPRASDGFFSLVKVEPEEDSDKEWDRAEYASNPQKALHRTTEWWEQVFGKGDIDVITKSYSMSPDFGE